MQSRRISMGLMLLVLLSVLLTGCTGIARVDPDAASETLTATPTATTLTDECAVTEPVWVKPPEDSAVQNPPAYGNYFVNEDGSIWASAWWTEDEEYPLRAGEDGVKVGWFRPAGSLLEITGRRLDGQAHGFKADIPCCYPTRFQATGLIFPTEGCWEVNAKAGDSELSFVVAVEP